VSARGPGTLRVVAGVRRGHRLRVPRGGAIRPTSEKVREAIFDALGPIDGLRALDLFAGTGALGLEALSRGAVACTFVEHETDVATVLRANIEALGYREASSVIVSDYRRAVARLTQSAPGFDLLFVDPPYRMLPEVEAALASPLPALMAEDGIVVIEGDRAHQPMVSHERVFDRTYGDTRVTMISMRRSDR